jgi:hypothetical protein
VVCSASRSYGVEASFTRQNGRTSNVKRLLEYRAMAGLPYIDSRGPGGGLHLISVGPASGARALLAKNVLARLAIGPRRDKVLPGSCIWPISPRARGMLKPTPISAMLSTSPHGSQWYVAVDAASVDEGCIADKPLRRTGPSKSRAFTWRE